MHPSLSLVRLPEFIQKKRRRMAKMRLIQLKKRKRKRRSKPRRRRELMPRLKLLREDRE